MKRSYKIIFTFLFFVSGIFFTQKLLKKYQTYSKFSSFFNNKEYNYDVFFLGTSHVLNGIFPMELWKEFGITSYNFAWHSTPIATNYYLLKMVERINKPKIVFIDILQLQEDAKYNVYMHQLFDYFPLEENKLEAIKDFLPGKENLKKRIEFYFPFIYCHSTWLDIKANNFYKEIPTKGADLRIGIKMPQEFNLSVSDYNGQDSIGLEYSKKIIAFCKENNIIPVFYLIPYPEQHNLDDWKKALCDILEKENVSFMEFPENIVDFNTDLYDINSHLNPSGAKKVTEYIGNYIVSNFDCLWKKSEDEVNKWNQDYEKYLDYCIEKLVEQTNIDNFFVLLNNKNYATEIKLSKSFVPTELQSSLFNQIQNKEIIYDNKTSTNHVKVFRFSDNKLILEKDF